MLTRRATTLVSVAAASLLVILKLGVGLVTGSLGLISSGIESSGDVIAAALTLFAVGLGARPADFEHPYGHRRAENLGALGEAAVLLGGGVLVSVEAIARALSGTGGAPGIHWYRACGHRGCADPGTRPHERLARRRPALQQPRAALQRGALRRRHGRLAGGARRPAGRARGVCRRRLGGSAARGGDHLRDPGGG